MKVLRSSSRPVTKQSRLSHQNQQKKTTQKRITRCSKTLNSSSPSRKISQIKTRGSSLKKTQSKRQIQAFTLRFPANQKKTMIPSKGKKISKTRNKQNQMRNSKMDGRSSQKNSFERVYRQFSKQKYNKYKAQFPKLKQSEVVTKIIKDWDMMTNKEKLELEQLYIAKKFLSLEQQSDSFQALERAAKINKEARLQAQMAANSAKERQKSRPPTYLHTNIRLTKDNDEECSDFNRHSQREESEIDNSISVRISYSAKQKRKRRNGVTIQKRKTILKFPHRSEKIKNSVNFKKRWQYYRAYYWSMAKPKHKKRVQFRRRLQKKLKNRQKTQKLQVMRRVVVESHSKFKPPSISMKVVYNQKKSRLIEGADPEITPSSENVLCHQCNKLINEKRSQACNKCNLIYHNECSKLVRKLRYCYGCCYNAEPIQRYTDLPAGLKFKKMKESWLVRSPTFVGEKLRLARKCQEQNQRILKQRLNCSYTFYNRYSFRFTKTIIPSVNPTFPKLRAEDVQVIENFAESRAFPPLQIKKHPKIDGYGAFAYRDIQKHQLIDSYSGAVLTQAYIEKNSVTPEYVMALLEGLSLHTTWSICPYKFCSFGPLLNCALKKKDINVETLMIVTDRHFLIILRAKRNIKKGEELMYQYNGRLEEYDTSGFNEI